MDERNARRERHDYFLQQREYDHARWDTEPAMLATSPYELGRSTLKWGAIALGCWAVISGGLYLGYIVLHTIIFGPDAF